MASPLRRVLALLSALTMGGTEAELCRIVAALQGTVADFNVAALAGRSGSHQVVPPVSYRCLGRSWTYDPLPLFRLTLALRRQRPDMVLTFDRHAFLYALVARLLSGTNPPILNRALETPGMISTSAKLQLKLARLLLRRHDEIIALSPALSELMTGYFRFPAGQVVTIPLAIDTEYFHPAQRLALREMSRRKYGLGRDTPTLVMIASFSENKNHLMAFDILHELVTTAFSSCHLLVVGTGPPVRELALRQACEARGITDRVHFLGLLADVRPPLSAADVLILTSFAEATPTVILEAFAMGIPVVVTRQASSTDQLGEDLQHLAVPVNDRPLFAERVAHLLNAPAECDRIGRLGRARVEQHFSLNSVIEQFEALIARA